MSMGVGVLVLGCGHISHIVKWIISFKIFFCTLRHRSDKLYMYVVIMTKEESTKIVNFMTLREGPVLVLGRGHISHIVKMHFSSLLPGINQTNYVCISNDDQGRAYQNYNFHDPRGRGSCARVWPYVILWKCIISFKIIFSTPRHMSDKLSM